MLQFYISLLETEEEKQTMTDIYEQYNYYCIYIAKKLLDNHDDAEDATHAAFLEIIRNKKKYFAMECSALRASLVVIVKNKAYDILRLRKRERADDTEELVDLADDEPTAEDFLTYQEEYDLLREALTRIKHSYGHILTLKYFEDLSNSEIAERLNTNKKNVEVMLTRARISLRKKLKEMKGGTFDESRI